MAKTCPPLPSGSVDLSVLHAADAKKDANLAEALAKATIRKEPPPAGKPAEAKADAPAKAAPESDA